MTTQRTLLAATLLVAFVCVSANAGIVGSNHDFSGQSWAKNQICLPCHAAHASSNSATNYKAGRLWNHELTKNTTNIKFDTYGSSSWNDVTKLPNNPVASTGSTNLDAGSILCMSCHDGSVAMDNFGGAQNGTNKMTGFYTKGAGGDLTGNHPLGSKGAYPTTDGKVSTSSSMGDPTRMGKAADGTTSIYRVSLQKMYTTSVVGGVTTNTQTYVVGCTTCHNPHNALNGARGDAMLRVPQTGSIQVPGSSATATVGGTDYTSTIRPGPIMYEVPGSGLCLTCHVK